MSTATTATRAAELKAQGLTPRQIADHLGISYSYACRIVNHYQETLQRCRNYKERRRRSCVDCDDPTWMTSQRCLACNTAKLKAEAVWSREGVIDAIQRFAAIHGRPPVSTEWIRADQENRYPSSSSVYGPGKPFAYWADAIDAAGFRRPRPGKNQDDTRPTAARIVLNELRIQGPMRYGQMNARYKLAGATSSIDTQVNWWLRHGYIERLERGLYRATDKCYRDEQ